MNNRSIHFLLAGTTIFSSGIFVSNSPAKAHSFDYCIEVLNNEAEIADTGTSELKLEQKYPEQYQKYLQECDSELKASGLLTIGEVRDKKNNKRVARLIRRLNRIDRDSLDDSKIRLKRLDVDKREVKMKRLRQQICANPAPDEEYACPKGEESSENGNVVPQSAVPKADNPLIAAAMGFGKQISQLVLGAVPARNTLVAALPSVSDTPARQTGLDKPGGTLVAQASSVGQWNGPYNWPLVVVHAAVGPNGKVLAWTRPKLSPTTRPGTGEPVPKYTLWTPPTNGPGPGSFSNVPNVTTDIFCAGHAFAPSGNLLVVGGHASDEPGDGSKDINVYNFSNNSWLKYPNRMAEGRWYPTVTYNANGEGVIVGGSVTNEGDLNPVPQVWGTSASIRTLNSASLALPVKPYVWNFAAPSGRIFNAGPTQATRALDTTGNGKWINISNHAFGNRYYGSAVMYDDGKVLTMGGSQDFYGNPTNTAEVVELFTSNRWIPVDSMQNRRRHHTATLLADGKVFVSGGTSEGSFNNASGRVLAGEIWDPVTTNWTTVASMKVTRSYHQTALLLPDARVLVAGGGLPAANGDKGDPDRNQGNFDAEIYSPAYLFNGQRPTISSAPTSVGYNQTFNVGTPNAGSISKVHWIRLSSFTHQFDENQRISRPAILSKSSNSLSVKAPSDKNLCPPGHYMMFILNDNGVPSVAKIIKVS